MKLKLVVASMSVLGLISCPVLAANQTTHKHHHTVAQTAVVQKDFYKDMPIAEVCPKVDMYDTILDTMSHNLGRAKPTLHCMDPLSLAGGMAFDAGWGNRHVGFAGENLRRFALNDAYINVFGNVNEWTTAFASLSYSNFEPNIADNNESTAFGVNNAALGSNPQSGVYSNSYLADRLQLEQGFITLKNMDVMPIFVRVGRMFEDFGRYNIHPITESMTQVMSEALYTTAQLGFITRMGFNGSVYTFENPMHKVSVGHNQNNYGASLNFNHPSDQLGFDVGAGYIYDITGVSQIAYAVNQFNGTADTVAGWDGTYQSRVGGGTLYGDLNSGPFTLMVRYVSALSSFNNADLATKTISALAGAPGSGAQPWSADITGGYNFNGWDRAMNLYLGYQASGNAVNLFLPKNRWVGGYGVNVLKSTNLGLEIDHDTAYSTSAGSTGNSSNVVKVRAAVQFG